MTITDVRLPCPECRDPAKAKKVPLVVEESTTLISHIPSESVACSNPDCPRWDPGSWPSPPA
ncbi:MAG: hypothetical protein ABSF33_16960 [Acidimicrobiales bacterium]|jgi:hypothetical protein